MRSKLSRKKNIVLRQAHLQQRRNSETFSKKPPRDPSTAYLSAPPDPNPSSSGRPGMQGDESLQGERVGDANRMRIFMFHCSTNLNMSLEGFGRSPSLSSRFLSPCLLADLTSFLLDVWRSDRT